MVSMGGGGHVLDGYATKADLEQIGSIGTSKLYSVEITTNSSTIISQATDQATLTCKVYSWDTDITDTLDSSLFMWKRVSSGTVEGTMSDAEWNAMPEHQGVKSIIIDADDVVNNSSFTCEVDLPE